MNRLPKIAALAGATALALASLPAHSLIVTEQFDGAWFNAAQSGRGLLVDVIPQSNGTYVFFGAAFTYDNAGNPFWYTIQTSLAEGQNVATNVEVRRFNGGSFGNTFTPPNPASGTVIGTGTLTVENCNSIKLDITTNAAANGLPNVNYSFIRLAGGAAATCPYTGTFTTCPAGTTAVAGQTAVCELTGTLTTNVVLDNKATYLVNGKVQVGTPLSGAATQTATLTIPPGTLLKGKGGTSDYLVVNPGSKIFAEGLPTAPVIFTGPTETGGSWAGLFIAGRAPVNKAATPGGTVPFEADANIIFGGNDPNDSSGVLRYVQVRHGGQLIAPNRELNTITFGGVGAGTVVDYVQAHNGTDDGFEWFGGTVNAKHLVATGNDDDNLDMDFGYTGKIQYAYIRPDAQIDINDGRCIESDGQDQNFDALPRTQPKIANVTCQGAASGATWTEVMRLRRGSAGNYFNVAFADARDACLRFNDSATYNASGPAGALTGTTTMQGAYAACTTNFADGTTPPFTVTSWYNGQAGNATGNVGTGFTGRFATPGGPLDGTAVAIPNDAFFERTTYKGAFGPAGTAADWAAGWTVPGSL
jgi:hypothetical protein